MIEELQKSYNNVIKIEEKIKLFNQEYEELDEIIKGPEKMLELINNEINKLKHQLTSKHHFLSRKRNLDAITDVIYFMQNKSNIIKSLQPYLEKKHELVLKGEGLLIAQTYAQNDYIKNYEINKESKGNDLKKLYRKILFCENYD